MKVTIAEGLTWLGFVGTTILILGIALGAAIEHHHEHHKKGHH